jgi:multiple sugar transport system permease protein
LFFKNADLNPFILSSMVLVLVGSKQMNEMFFQGGWNNFMWPNIVLISENVKLLTQAFGRFRSPQLTELGPLMALSTLMILPIIVIFIFAQKYFIKGISVGGIKG